MKTLDQSPKGSNDRGVSTAADSLQAFVAARALRDGDRLPPERDLAIALRISRRALRQTLAQMELDGEIWRGKRIGTFLGRRAPEIAASVDRSLARASPAEIMECRLMLEPAIASSAALKATEADLAKIESCLRRSTEVTDDESWSRWDGAFHSAIAEASRNAVLEEAVRAFNTARKQLQWSSMRVALVTPQKRRRQVAAHREILAALRKRQSNEAAHAMRRHLLSVWDDISGI